MPAPASFVVPPYSSGATASAPLDTLADWLLRTTWQVAVLVSVVGMVQLIAGRRLAPRWRFALWAIVVVRLLLPATPASPWSLFNLSLPTATFGNRVDAPTRHQSADEAEAVNISVVVAPLTLSPPNVMATLPPLLPPEPPAAPFNWRHAIIGVWLAGVTFAGLRIVVGTALLRRKLRRAATPSNEVRDSFERACRQMGVIGRIPIFMTDAVAGPALFGFLRPRLLLPPALLRQLSPAELRFVFLHELAHVKRRDPLTNAALLLASAVHWFNPFARFALARCRAERELACDELVMDATSLAARPGYGQAVLRVAETFCAGRPGGAARAAAARTRLTSAPAIGMIAARSQLRRRIAMISTFEDAPRRHVRSILPALLMLGICSCALTDREPDVRGGSDETSADGATTTAGGGGNPKEDADAPQASRTAEGTLIGGAAAPGDGGQDPPSAAADAARAAGSERPDPRLQAMLKLNIPEVTFDAVSFTDVMNFLQETTNANMLIDWKALQGVGIDRHAKVTVRLRNISFAKALGIVLDQVGGGEVLLGYMVEGNLIRITTGEEVTKRSIKTRVYEIRDLLVDVPDFTDAPNFGAFDAATEPAAKRPEPKAAAATTKKTADEEPTVAEKTRSREELIEEITTLIKETVDPDSWRDNGGSIGGIRELQGQLIVTQTDENHRQLITLLDQLRETRAVQVTVEARFVSVALEKLEGPLPDKLRQTIGRSEKPAVSVLTDEEVTSLLRETQQTREAEIVTAPRITLFNGQRAYVLVARTQAYVSGYTVVKADAGETRYEPQTSQVQHGILFDVAATASADRKHVTLTLRPKLTALTGMKTAPYVGMPGAPANLTVEVPLVDVRELQTTANVPDRGTLLLAGFRHAGGDGDAAIARPAGDLFLLVKPTLVVTAPPKREDFPLISK